MKRVVLSLLAIILILGALGAAGFAGYQYGYRQGALVSSGGNAQLPPGHPNVGPFGMPRDGFGFRHGFGHGFGMMPRGILARVGKVTGNKMEGEEVLKGAYAPPMKNDEKARFFFSLTKTG